MASSPASAFQQYFEEIGLPISLNDAYMRYAKRLESNDAPIIFEFDHLAYLLGKTNSYLASVVNRCDKHYRTFSIPKKSGGLRKIEAPYPALLDCQNWIRCHILRGKNVSNSAHGYVGKRSIKTHVKGHIGRTHILKLDIKNFFPSLKIGRVISFFRALGYAQNVSFYLSALCCLRGSLPQGAPTSPELSNILSYKLDQRLRRFAHCHNLRYSRYVDDLVFSGRKIESWMIGVVAKILYDEKLVLNEKKTRIMKKGQRRVLCGIDITNNRMKPTKDFRRQIRQEMHFIEKYGILSHMMHCKITNYNYIDQLLGRVNFWLFLEEGNKEARNYKIRLLSYLSQESL